MSRFQQGEFAANKLSWLRTTPQQESWPLNTKGEHNMRVGVATDHGGFGLKEDVVAYLREAGHEVVDVGAYSLNPGDDYPHFIIPLAQAVAAGEVERGIAICGSR